MTMSVVGDQPKNTRTSQSQSNKTHFQSLIIAILSTYSNLGARKSVKDGNYMHPGQKADK